MFFLPFLSSKINPIVRWLILIIVLSLGVTLILTLLQVKPNTFSYIKRLASHPGTDSWQPMIDALNLILRSPDQPVYDILFERGVKFQYPLSSLLMFDLPERILGISYIQTSFLLDRFSTFCVPLFSFISARILIIGLRNRQLNKVCFESKAEIRWTYFLVLILTFLFYPILRSVSLGQIQTILTVLTATAILCWQLDKKVLVGLIFGL